MKKFFTVVSCFVLFLLFSSMSFALSESVVVISFAGEVKVTPEGLSDSIACVPNMSLKEGTRIVTGNEAYVELAFNRAKNNIVKINANSDVIIKLDGPDRIELIEGRVIALMKGLKNGEVFRIRTPDAVCGARGTGWETSSKDKVTDVGVFDDKVFVRGLNKDGSVKEQEFWVNNGFQRKIERFSNPGKMEKMSEQRMQGLKNAVKLPGFSSSWFGGTMKGINRDNKMREQRVESIQDRKDETRLDQIREDREKKEDNHCPPTSGPSISSE